MCLCCDHNILGNVTTTGAFIVIITSNLRTVRLVSACAQQ